MKNSAKQGCENMEIKMTTTDTPRTDAVQFQKKPISLSIENEMLRALSRKLERELTASKAEVKEIRSALGDDGRRTHKELLGMAFKASGWKTWKEKYIDLKNAHIAEGQDPDGTIWEHADKLQKELKEAKAEVERLNGLVMEAAQKGDELLEPHRLRAEKAETLLKQIHAFVEALNTTNK